MTDDGPAAPCWSRLPEVPEVGGWLGPAEGDETVRSWRLAEAAAESVNFSNFCR